MTPSEKLVIRLVGEEVESLLEEGFETAVFGTRASVRVAERVAIDARRVHQLWLRTQFA